MIREILEPMEVIQTRITDLLKKAREAEDKNMVDGVISNPPYPDHVIVAMTIAVHELLGSDQPFDEELILSAITVLDTLDTQNMKVTGK